MKNFTNNFKQFTSRLSARWLIMALMLLAGTGSAWAWTVIYDNSETKWTEVYLYVGKGDWSECNLKMTEYDTNLFFFNGSGWDDATEIAFGNAELSGSTSGNICSKLKTTSSSTYNYGKDFSKTYKYKATGLTSADKDCSNKQRYYWPDTNARVEVSNFSIQKIQLAGDFNNWGSSTDICYSQSGSTCSFEKELSAKNKYEFKIIIDGTWYSSGGSISVGGNKVTFYTDKGNSYFTAASDGIYTFNIDKDKKVWITYRTACTKPSAPTIEINDESSVTLCEGSATITTTEVTGATSYSLYKGSATTASQTNATGTFTVSEPGTYYVTVTTCTESDESTGVTLSYYTAPTLTDKYSVTNATKCNNTPNNDGAISIQNGVDGVTYSLNDDEGTSWSDLAKGTYTLKATLDACNKLSDTKTVEVGETDKTPAINDISIKEVSAVCKGEDLTLQLNEEVQDGVTYTWYKSNTSSSSIGTGTSLALTDLQETSTYILVASKTENSCTATKEASIEVTVNAIPTAPDAITFDPVCSGVSFELPEIIGKWYASEQDEDPIAKTITDGITTQTTYYASAIENNCESTGRTPLVVDVKNKPAVPTLTAENNVTEIVVGQTTATLLVGNLEQDATYTLYKDGEPTQNTGTSFIVSEGGTYKVVASNNNGCGTSESDEITITACTPISNVEWSITNGENDVYCSGDEVQVTLNYNGDTATEHTWNLNGVTVSNEDDIASGTIYTIIIKQSGSVQLTLTGCAGEPYSTSMQFLVSSETVAPTIGISKNSICEGDGEQTITVNGYNPNYTYALYKDGVKQNITISNTGTFTVNTTGEYTVTAKNCVESTPSNMVSLTVNPLPTITSILASNDEPVLFEDVVLTADGVTPGAEVRWYLGEDVTPVATGTTYIVTSENAGEVIVKAKAFLNGCESDFKEHEVTFSEEDCSNSDVTIESTKIEIWCRETGSSQAGSNLTCYAWYKDGSNHELNSDNTNKGTKTSVTKTSNIEGQEYTYRVWEFDMQNYGDYDVYVIFKKSTTAWDWQTSDLKAGKRNNRYFFTYDGSQNEQSNRGEIYSESQSLSVTTHSISAPAVKTVSVNSEQGSGVVNFVGRVIKTGCAAATKIFVGYQYKLATDPWPNNVTAGNAIGNLIVVPDADGKTLHETYSATISGLPDDNYVFRAYIINGYNFTNGNYDQGVYYGIDIPVTVSSVKEAVKDPVLQWIDEEGDPYPGGAYCPDATAYVKLTYGGSKPETVVWSNSISDSNPVSVKESLGENWYKLTVEKSGDLSVSLANEYNTTGAVQTDAISLTMTSRISFPTTEVIDGKTTICSNDANGTKLRVTNAVVDYQYSLYKVTNETEGTSTKVEGPITATDGNKDNLTFTIQGADAAGKYFVQVEETVCDQTAVSQGYTTIEVIDAGAITLTLEPSEVTVNPWLPAVLTVSITEGYDYTIDIPAPLVYTANGNVYTIKAPEPADAEYQPSSQQNQKQYGKVTFEETNYTVTADLKTDTGSSCITEKTSTITLTPYVEDCVSEYENQ